MVIFVLLSILAHVVVFAIVAVLAIFMPTPKLESRPTEVPSVSLSLMPAPQPPPPKQKPIFMATDPQKNVPKQKTIVESDNDTQLKSQSKTARSDSIMPDVVAKQDHTSDLHNSPNSPQTKKPEIASTPPTPKQDQSKPQPPTPPQPKTDAQQAQQQPQPQPTKPLPKPPEPKPPKPPTPQVAKNDVDPNTGLPVLPAIDAPTLAPQTSANQSQQSSTPPDSLAAVAANLQGRAGMSGAPSVASTATELGKYKAMVYRAVGSRWYQKVNNQLQVMPVGMVRVQYTIYSNGLVETKVLDGGNGSMQVLLSISVLSIREAAPFPAFTDAMRQQVGDSFTDDFSFSVYSP